MVRSFIILVGFIFSFQSELFPQKIFIKDKLLSPQQMEALELLTPFKAGKDSDALKKSVYDSYLKNLLAVEDINSDSLINKDIGLKRKIAIQQKIARNKILNLKYSELPAAKDSVKHFYYLHPDLFSEPMHMKAMIAVLHDTSTATKTEVLTRMKKYRKNTELLSGFKKEAGQLYDLRIEENLVEGKGMYLTGFMKLPGLKTDSIIRYLQSNGELLIIWVMQLNDRVLQPFETVKQKASELYQKQRSERLAKQLLSSAGYTITFSRDYYSERTHNQHSVFGTIGADTINNDFLEAIQLSYPSFSFSSDSAELLRRLLTYYILPDYFADKVARNKKQIKPYDDELAFADSLISNRAIASLENKNRSAETVPAQALEDYYKAHPDEFTDYGSCSYVYAALLDTSASVIQAALGAVNRALTSDSLVSVKNNGFKLSYQLDYTFRQNNEMTGLLKELPLNKTSGPFYFDHLLPMIIAVTLRTDNKLKSFSSVKGKIYNKIYASWTAEKENEVMKKAFEMIRVEY